MVLNTPNTRGMSGPQRMRPRLWKQRLRTKKKNKLLIFVRNIGLSQKCARRLAHVARGRRVDKAASGPIQHTLSKQFIGQRRQCRQIMRFVICEVISVWDCALVVFVFSLDFWLCFWVGMFRLFFVI